MSSTRKANQSAGVKVLDKTFDILEAIGADERGTSLTDLAIELELPTATVFRLLQHLVRRGYVEQDPTSKLYYLGLRVLVLRGGAIRAVQLAARARPFLRELMTASNCVAHLAVYRDTDVVYIDRVDTPNTAAVWVPVGDRAPAHCTALGKALLASMPDVELEDYLARASLVRRTPQTLTDPDLLRAHLRVVREQGYATDIQEATLGVWCVASPIHDYTGRAIAAVSVSMRSEPSPQRLEQLIPLVMDTALKVSKEVGYQPQMPEASLAAHVV